MNEKIGVIDSGMGGLTVVRSLFLRNVPADIVYVGDNANVPYGNRPLDEIVELTLRMLKVLSEHNIRIVAIACNTISATIERLKPYWVYPIIDIISPVAQFLANCGESDIGLFATEFTVRSGLHAKLVGEINPGVHIHGVPSRRLAALIDESIEDESAIREEISSMLAQLAALHPVHKVLLGCTHYPIVMDLFEKLAPEKEYIDPADLQAKAIIDLLNETELKSRSIENGREGVSTEIEKQAKGVLFSETAKPSLEIVTSGTEDAYRTMLSRLGIPKARSIDRLL